MYSSVAYITSSNGKNTSSPLKGLLPDDSPLVTSNPKIFPSLHPLSALYRQKESNSKSSEPIEGQESSKKLVFTDGAQKLARPVQPHNNPIKHMVKEMKNVKTSPTKMSRAPFAMPRKAQRLDTVGDFARLDACKQEDMGSKITLNFEFQEALMMPDNVPLQQRRDQPLPGNFESQKIGMAQAKSFAKQAPMDMMNCKAKPQMFSSIYKSLQLDYYALEMKKRLIEIEQEKIAQAIQDLVRESESGDAEIQRNDSVETAAESVKEEYLY